MSHTPAPWELDETHFLHALNNNMVVVPIVDYAHAKACVNACAEFPDPKIDIGLLKLDNEQKAKLLVSCEMALTERDTEIAELKARVKELEQGVKDAIAEMDRYYSLKLGVRILTDKTKLQQ